MESIRKGHQGITVCTSRWNGITGAAGLNRMSAVIGTQVDLFCEDVERCARSFEIRPPMDGPGGRPRYVWMLDPEGHKVRLLQERTA